MRRLFVSSAAPTPAEEFERTVVRLERYRDPALITAPRDLITGSAELPRIRTLHRRPVRGLLDWQRREVGSEEHLSFATPYTPLDPEYAQEFARSPEIAQAHVWAWRHRTPAPATILLTHGWGVGAWWMHRFEFNVPRLFHELGLDVYFYLAPFHERRTPAHARLSGQLHPSPDLVRTNEAFIQTSIELRTVISLILDRNPKPLGMMGSSLGGYTSALMASLDERLSFVIPVLPLAIPCTPTPYAWA